jgi:hypothetical protein
MITKNVEPPGTGQAPGGSTDLNGGVQLAVCACHCTHVPEPDSRRIPLCCRTAARSAQLSWANMLLIDTLRRLVTAVLHCDIRALGESREDLDKALTAAIRLVRKA